MAWNMVPHSVLPLEVEEKRHEFRVLMNECTMINKAELLELC